MAVRTQWKFMVYEKAARVRLHNGKKPQCKDAPVVSETERRRRQQPVARAMIFF